MPFDASLALTRFLPLARAAYDLSRLPADFTLIGRIEPTDFGFVSIDTEAQIIQISFRGTEHPLEWAEDFDALPVACEHGAGTVAQGFQLAYNSIRLSVLTLLEAAKEKVPVQVPSLKLKLEITGHSLGAELAVLCAGDITSDLFDLSVHTFAGPKGGKQDFVSTFNPRVPSCYRIVNRWDVVPHGLPSFYHVGQEESVDGGFPFALGATDLKSFEDVAHSLDSYERGLKAMIS